MPSIRVRNSQYVSIRDLFNEQGSPAPSPQVPTPSPLLSSAQSDLLSRNRPTSLPVGPNPNQDILNDTPLLSPLSLRAPEDPTRAQGRRRSNSRVHAHLQSTYSTSTRNPWATESQRMTAASTDGLTTHGSPVPSHTWSPAITGRHPPSITVEGSRADVSISGDGSPGILEKAFPEHRVPRTPQTPSTQYDDGESEEHHDDIVEHLDVIDPQVGTFSNLTNAANSIVLPPLGFSRKPVITLSAAPNRPQQDPERSSQYEDALDRHVDDVLQSPSKWRRTMMGVWSFLKTPMGILTGIYGFLVVFWGAAIVFFLAKIINLHNPNTQGFWVEVSSQVVCGLFTITSVGFIPSRVLSTWRIWKIWRYKKITIKRRKDAGLPQLFDPDDLPDPAFDPNFVRVLSEEEHHDLHRQQRKFAYHQTWYRAHGSETHRAFPITTALWICLMNDFNSIFQLILCGTMWGMNRFRRPAWSTGILIPAGFLAGIGAAVLIWRGGERTKRVEEVRERLRAALLAEFPRPGPSPLQSSITRKPVDSGDANVEEKPLENQDRPDFGTMKFKESKPLPAMPLLSPVQETSPEPIPTGQMARSI